MPNFNKYTRCTMYNITKRIRLTAILLALLAATSLLSCGSTETETTTADTAATEAAETTPEETKYVADYLPQRDFEGYQYRLVDYEEWPAHIEEPSGETLDDAVYQRNLLVEEAYNIAFTSSTYPYTEYPKVATLVKNAAQAQSDDFDLAFLTFRDAYNAILGGEAPTASELPYADLTQPWYNRTINDSMTIDGVALMGYTCFEIRPGGQCVVFNKRLIDDLNLENPYDLVDDGTWTCDKLYKMAESAIMDLDGDGQMTAADRFGFITEWDRISLVAYYGTGSLLVNVIDGIPVASQAETLVEAFTKCVDYLKIDGFMLDTFKEYGTAESSRVQGRELYKQGNGLFLVTGTSATTTMGDMEDDYGIVPMPKWTAEQNRYYAMLDGGQLALPPSCSTDLERVCIIKEALAVESLNLYYPAYYEDVLQNRYLRDEESLRMLEIITNSVVQDLGQSPWWDIVRTPWQDTLQKKSTDFMSAVQKNMLKCEKAIADMLELVASIKEGK